MAGQRVMVTGSRVWVDPDPIWMALSGLPEGTTILQGGARGADRIAAEMAVRLGLVVEWFPARWSQWGNAAGVIRNVEMLESGVDQVFAFARPGLWASKGTRHAVTEAKRRGIAVRVWEQE